ncbi:MAG: carbohydrate transporter permease [Clostridia bacterium]|jgi:putative aldouronate transport system permease protein|nr:carbohydrate transporter permease [Clostridia bacterium]
MGRLKIVKNGIGRSRSDLIFDVINFVFFTLAMLVVLYPLYFIVIASISDPYKVAGGQTLLRPAGLNFEGYIRVFTNNTILIGYRNSLFYAVFGTFINLLFTLPPAYALSRKNLAFKPSIMIYLMIPMYFGGGLIPSYILVKNLGMLDSIWSLLVPGAVSIWSIIIARSFFQSNIPEELYESAVIDGCSHLRFFLSIVLPLSKALIAVLVLQFGLGHWNSWFSALIYISNKNLYPLQLVLRNILIVNDPVLEMIKDQAEIQRRQRLAETLKYASIIVSSVPVLIIYPFLQKYFAKGVLIGSIKG